MKDLLSKRHYCYKTHTLLMKSSAYRPAPFYEQPNNPSIWTTPHFTRKLISPSLIFQKAPTNPLLPPIPPNGEGGVHTTVL